MELSDADLYLSGASARVPLRFEDFSGFETFLSGERNDGTRSGTLEELFEENVSSNCFERQSPKRRGGNSQLRLPLARSSISATSTNSRAVAKAIRSLQDKIRELETANELGKGKMNSLRAEMERMKQERETEVAHYRRDIEELRHKSNGEMDRRRAAEEDLRKCREALTGEKRKNEDLNSRIESLERICSTAESQCEMFKKAAESSSKKNEELQHVLDLREKSIKDLVDVNQELMQNKTRKKKAQKRKNLNEGAPRLLTSERARRKKETVHAQLKAANGGQEIPFFSGGGRTTGSFSKVANVQKALSNSDAYGVSSENESFNSVCQSEDLMEAELKKLKRIYMEKISKQSRHDAISAKANELPALLERIELLESLQKKIPSPPRSPVRSPAAFEKKVRAMKAFRDIRSNATG